jgi:hypothetical protein
MTEGCLEVFSVRRQTVRKTVFQAAELPDHPTGTIQKGSHLVAVGKAMPEAGEPILHGLACTARDVAVGGGTDFFKYRRHAFQDLSDPAISQAGGHQSHNFTIFHLVPGVKKGQWVGVDIGPLMVLPVTSFKDVNQGL